MAVLVLAADSGERNSCEDCASCESFVAFSSFESSTIFFAALAALLGRFFGFVIAFYLTEIFLVIIMVPHPEPYNCVAIHDADSTVTL